MIWKSLSMSKAIQKIVFQLQFNFQRIIFLCLLIFRKYNERDVYCKVLLSLSICGECNDSCNASVANQGKYRQRCLVSASELIVLLESCSHTYQICAERIWLMSMFIRESLLFFFIYGESIDAFDCKIGIKMIGTLFVS